jgi:hypothetical protein
MQIGNILQHKEDGTYATVEYSTFGFSLHFWDEENQVVGKTLGRSANEILKYWEVVDMPEGYEKMVWGGLWKIK